MAGSQEYCISSMMTWWDPIQERSIMSGSQVYSIFRKMAWWGLRTGEINHINAHHGRIPGILYLQHDGMEGPSTGEINLVNAHHGRIPGISPA
jgi:hypothetical protein